MFQPDPSSSGWADKILWIFGGTGMLAGLGTLLNWISNRKKPVSEIAAMNADTDVKLSAELRQLHGMFQLMEAQADIRQREHWDAIRHYRMQVEYFEKAHKAYVDRSHAFGNELSRLVLEIRKLEAVYAEKTGEFLTPVVIRTSEEITGNCPLPTPPDG